jgi:hypothetical protein
MLNGDDTEGVEWFRFGTCNDTACPNNQPGHETSTLVPSAEVPAFLAWLANPDRRQ